MTATPRVKPEQVVIISFNEEVLRACRQTLPRVKVNWLTSFKRENRVGSWRPSADSVLETLQRLGATGLGSKAEPGVVNRSFVSRLRAAGHELHCWTINDVAVAKKFRDLGVDSITTDRPAVIRAALGERSPVPAH